MKGPYRQICLLYVRYKTLMILSGLLILGGVASSAILRFGWGRFSIPWVIEIREDVTVFLFVFGVWLLMVLGVFLKRQFATYRAHLLPRYRKPHATTAFFAFFAFLITAVLWLASIPAPVVATSAPVLRLIVLQGVAFFLLTLYLGYLSVEVVLLLAYLVISFGSSVSWNVFGILGSPAGYFAGSLALSLLIVLFLIFFRARLLTLNEEHFEYPYLLTWPPKELAKNQARVYDLFLRWENFIDKALGRRPQPSACPVYPKEKNILRRSWHWDCFEQRSLRHLLILLLIATPLYMGYLKANPQVYGFFTGVHSNFFLLVSAPILAALCFNYKKMGYWKYDMMKPIRRRDIIKQRGVALVSGLVSFWALFVVYFAVLPDAIINPALLRTPLFWAHLFLTGCYSFAAFAWIIFLSCLSVTSVIVLNFIALLGLSLFQMIGVVVFPIQFLIAMSIASLAAGAVFFKTALIRWCQKELT